MPPGVDCGSTCSNSFWEGTVITLTVRPNTDSSFAGWSGGCGGTHATCVLTLSSDVTVTATFDHVTTMRFKLTVTKKNADEGDGTVTNDDGFINCGTTCNTLYFPDAAVTLHATASANSTFAGWGGPCSGTDACAVTMDKAKTVTATFVGPQKLTLKKNTVNKGNGTVQSNPAGISCGTDCTGQYALYALGKQITLTATPDSDSVFAGWSPASLCPDTGDCKVTMDKAKNVTAKFTGNPVLTVKKISVDQGTGEVKSTPDGIDCGTTCKASFKYGSSVVLSATADDGSVFSGWSPASLHCPDTGDCKVTMDKAKNVTAKFTGPPVLTVKTASVNKGTGRVKSTPDGIDCGATCNANFEYGSSVVLSATADDGSVFSGWSPASLHCPDTGDCTVTMDKAKNVTAKFTRK